MRVVVGPEREEIRLSAGANALVPRRGMPTLINNEVFMMTVADNLGMGAMNAVGRSTAIRWMENHYQRS